MLTTPQGRIPIGEYIFYSEYQYLWAQKCNFSGVFSIGNEVAILSWEDYKLYNSGWSGMINSSSSGCTLDAKDQILNEKNTILRN